MSTFGNIIQGITQGINTATNSAGKAIAKDFVQSTMPDKPQSIEDKTFENVEQPITTPKEESMQVSNNSTIQQAFENAKKLQEEQWAREDEIRKHVEEREDNAWQRSIKDMIKAGINPNLVSASPAASGGGISQSTGIDYTIYEKEFDQNLDLIMQEIEQKFEGSQAEKDRIKDLIKSLITGGALLGGAAMRGGK